VILVISLQNKEQEIKIIGEILKAINANNVYSTKNTKYWTFNREHQVKVSTRMHCKLKTTL
jgi:hypothetical protein